MKKHLLFLFAALLPLVTNAHDFEVGGIYYNITSSTTAEVTFKGSNYYEYSNEYSGSITIPATVTYNGVAYSVTSIGDDAFAECSSLTAIKIPEGVTSIGDYAFQSCSCLTAITIPEGVTSIGSYAFYYCSSLTAITIPESVTSIGNYAFRGCSSLTAITIPESVTSIGSSAFAGCSSLTAISVAEGNTIYDSRGGCNAIIETNSNTLISGCATTIIPASVTSIGESAFAYCSSLTYITIPEGVTSIGIAAFLVCSKLTAITCKATTPPSIDFTFHDVSKSIPVYVPAGSVEAYKAAEGWSEFTNIQPLSNVYILTVSSAGYATLYLDYAAKIPDNVKAYIATSVEGDRLMMNRVTGVLPAETGVIVRAEAGEYTFAKSDDTPANVEGNLLSGTAANTYITAESGYKYYVLAKKNDVVAMYHPQLTDGRFLNNANKSYLALKADDLGIFDEETNTEAEGGQLSNRLRFDFGGTTDIEMTTDSRRQTTELYDLHGRRVTNIEKPGIYIVDGRKVVIK